VRVSTTELVARLQKTEAELATSRAEVASLAEANRALALEKAELQQRIDALCHRLYGKRAERVDPAQLAFAFEELEREQAEAHPAPQDPSEADTGEVLERRPRKGHGRKKPSKELPRERIEHRPDPKDCVCERCRAEKVVIGETTSLQYDYRPASVRVLEHARIKLACPSCKDGVVVAPPVEKLVDKGLATAGMVAHVIVSKSADHQPLYRQAEILARAGADLTDSTLLSFFNQGAALLAPLAGAVLDAILAGPFLHADETPVTMKLAPSGTQTAYLWTYSDRTQVAYRFTTSRGAEGPLAVLEAYGGYVHKDGYTGYDAGMRKGGSIYVACWAHARRKFYEALRSGASVASRMMALIAQLYQVETEAREFDDEHRCATRQARSVPLLLRIEEEAELQRRTALPKSPMGEALTYLRNQWPGLRRYVEHGMLAIDNNEAERMIKPVALGRRNWLFAGSEDGGHRAAVCYTLVNSCKRIGLDPFIYLEDVLRRVGSHPMSRVAELTPKAWKQARDAARLPVGAAL
jgi:transposase